MLVLSHFVLLSALVVTCFGCSWGRTRICDVLIVVTGIVIALIILSKYLNFFCQQVVTVSAVK